MQTQTILFNKGLIIDRPSYSLPRQAVNYAHNVLYIDGAYRSSPEQGDKTSLPSNFKPELIARLPNSQYVLAGADSIQIYNPTGDTFTNAATVSGGENYAHELVNDISVLSGDNLYPVAKKPNDVTYSPLLFKGDKTFKNLTFNAKVIRSHRNFLFALNLIDGADELPNAVRWSDVSDTGSLPSDWSIDDPTSLAGQVALVEGRGDIIDGAGLPNAFYVFKENGIFRFAFVGGDFVFDVSPVSHTAGVLSLNCIARVDNALFVFGSDDIYISQNNQVRSIADERVRRSVFNSIDTKNYRKSFVLSYYEKDLVYFCYPETGFTRVNKAAVFNTAENSWTTADFNMNFAAAGTINTDARTWDSESSTSWSSNNVTWANPGNRLLDTVLGIGETHIREFRPTTTSGMVARNYLLPLKLSVAPAIRFIRLLAEGEGVVLVRVGSSKSSSSSVVFKPAISYDVSTARRIPIRTSLPYFHIEISFPTGGDISLSGFEIEYDTGATR